MTRLDGKKMIFESCREDRVREERDLMDLWDANEFDGMPASKLSQYTLMRLYSADKSWCDDVGFSILRLAAFG